MLVPDRKCEPKHTFKEIKLVRNKHQEDSNPGSDPSLGTGSDPGSDPGFIISLSGHYHLVWVVFKTMLNS